MVCSNQEFVEVLTEELRHAKPQAREEFRRVWWAQVIAKEKEKESDRRFLRSIGVDPDGD
jgi:hypothetical protein